MTLAVGLNSCVVLQPVIDRVDATIAIVMPILVIILTTGMIDRFCGLLLSIAVDSIDDMSIPSVQKNY